MSDETKAKIYIAALVGVAIYLVIAWYGDKRTCEDKGGIYAKSFWAWNCLTIYDFKEK
ncbi:MAG: hypothetical protein H0X02_06745 [Nitrosomonas sp.]|nr:hypothetical protein [Nitrosomonas sp.]